MGVDAHGKNPTSESGKYFRNSWWWWRPLADYVIAIAPEIALHCTHWQSNDGDGLNEAYSRALADRLQSEIDAGRTEKYARGYASKHEAMPNEPCRICAGTGTRKPVPETGAGDLATGIKCNGCNGDGYVRPKDTWYPFDVENAQNFANFLRDCGGFSID